MERIRGSGRAQCENERRKVLKILCEFEPPEWIQRRTQMGRERKRKKEEIFKFLSCSGEKRRRLLGILDDRVRCFLRFSPRLSKERQNIFKHGSRTTSSE
jgi:hypothetical protein